MTQAGVVPWVVFDFGGVILTTANKEEYEAACAKVLKRLAHPSLTTSTDMKRRVYDREEFQLAKVGKMTSDELYSAIMASYGVTNKDEITEFRDAVRIVGKHVHPKLVEYVNVLKSRGVHVGVLSNFESDLLDTMRVKGIEGLFPPEVIWSSYDFQCAKPSTDIFAKASERIRTLTEQRCGGDRWKDVRVVFVDDKEKNVQAAEACGFLQSGIVYKSIDQCIGDIESALEAWGC